MHRLYSDILVVLAAMSLALSPLAVERAESAESPANVTTITAAGSGVNLGITRLLATAFAQKHPEVRVDVPGSIGSKGGIIAAAEGAIPLGLVSRPLKAKEQDLGLVYHPYARVAMIIGTHPSVTDENITSADLVQIFQGNKSRWQDGHEIIVLSREEGDSGFGLLAQVIKGFQQAWDESLAAKRWTVHFNDQDANRALAATPYALGVADLGMITTEHLSIKPLALDGFPPTEDNVGNGSYRLIRELAFVYRPDTLPEAAKAFMDFVTTEAGKTILRNNQYISLP